MNLQEELAAMLVAATDNDPVWSSVIDNPKIVLTGPPQETLQAIVNATTAYSDVLLRMIMRIAEEVDELKGNAEVDDDG